MLYFVFTIDGDWAEYFDKSLPEDKRLPELNKILPLVEKSVRLAHELISGHILHFVHTSPRARDFFLRPELVELWKEVEIGGGSIGVHCHEDEPHKEYYYNDTARMRKSISEFAAGLRSAGLSPLAYRGGYMTFSPEIIPILEENRIFLDFSCEPGRYLTHNEKLVADWRDCPRNIYQMDYADPRKPGKSRVFEVPVGSALGRYLYIEKTSLYDIWRVARALSIKGRFQNLVVSILTHTYEYRSFFSYLKIRLALLILKLYGRFISASEIIDVLKEGV